MDLLFVILGLSIGTLLHMFIAAMAPTPTAEVVIKLLLISTLYIIRIIKRGV